MDNTSIRYAEVAEAISVIRDECLPKMRNIFDDFNNSLQTVGNPNIFVGDANETLQNKAKRLSAKFSDFERLVKEFAEKFETASQSTSQTEQKLSQDAENINSIN